jgi:magnesium transporter
MATTRLYTDGVLSATDFPVEDISTYIGVSGCAVWVDFESPSPGELDGLEQELGLHNLAIEDALHDHQRPKLDRYESHLFLAAYDVSLDRESGQLSKTEVKAFITPTCS